MNGLTDAEKSEIEALEAEEAIERNGPDGAPGYEHLARILALAYAQSAYGKSKKRHARGRPFDKQPIMEIARMVGLGGHTYQICKKAQEATAMAGRNEHEAAKAELLGVIVYAAAGILLIEEQN